MRSTVDIISNQVLHGTALNAPSSAYYPQVCVHEMEEVIGRASIDSVGPVSTPKAYKRIP